MMLLIPAVLYVQGVRDLVLDIPAPRGIYKPDFSSCSEKDRDLYQAIFQGYLSVTRDGFSISIFRGTWKRSEHDLQLRVSMFMDQKLKSDKAKFDDSTLMSGFIMTVLPNDDLALHPAKGMSMKSGLRFHREPTIKLVDALKAEVDFLDGEMTRESEFTLGAKIWDQMYDLKPNLKSGLLDIAESDEPISIRAQAAMDLDGLHGDDLVRRAGSLLLKISPSKERNERIFQTALARALANSHHPASMYYAQVAKKKGLISNGAYRSILSNCGNPEAIPILYDMAKTSKVSELPYILEAMRHLSPNDGLRLAKEMEKNANTELQFEILRTRAECETPEAARNEAIRAMMDRYDKVDWMGQFSVVESLGIAQTDLAFRYLKKIARAGKGKQTDYHLVSALEKYGSKRATVNYP